MYHYLKSCCSYILVLSADRAISCGLEVEEAQLHWRGPGVTLKMCHWISMWASAFSLLQSPTNTLRAACTGLSTKPCSWCGFMASFFRMKNVKILHLPLFFVFVHACFGKFSLLNSLLQLTGCCNKIVNAVQIYLRASGLMIISVYNRILFYFEFINVLA